jgi:hypothetical protein
MIPSHVTEWLDKRINANYGHLIKEYDREPQLPAKRMRASCPRNEPAKLRLGYRQKLALEWKIS